MMLIYSLPATEAIYQRFVGIDGSAYFVGGLGMTALTANNMVLVPIRSGVGFRLGANVEGFLRLLRGHQRERLFLVGADGAGLGVGSGLGRLLEAIDLGEQIAPAVQAHGHHPPSRRPKQQRAGALQDASRHPGGPANAPASWT